MVAALQKCNQKVSFQQHFLVLFLAGVIIWLDPACFTQNAQIFSCLHSYYCAGGPYSVWMHEKQPLSLILLWNPHVVIEYDLTKTMNSITNIFESYSKSLYSNYFPLFFFLLFYFFLVHLRLNDILS